MYKLPSPSSPPNPICYISLNTCTNAFHQNCSNVCHYNRCIYWKTYEKWGFDHPRFVKTCGNRWFGHVWVRCLTPPVIFLQASCGLGWSTYSPSLRLSADLTGWNLWRYTSLTTAPLEIPILQIQKSFQPNFERLTWIYMANLRYPAKQKT